MALRKILIISYYWPPSGGSGVQRWLKFVKYLPQFGWKPYVFTPENPSFVQKDESLMADVPSEAEVVRIPIWEPYDLFFKLSGSRKGASAVVSSGKKSLFQRLANWIRGNVFIPDPKVYWVRRSVRYLNEYLKSNNIKTIVTTGPPHSMHLIGLGLKKKNPSLIWLVDFRDPWSEWAFIKSFNPSPWVLRQHVKMEKMVLMSADIITTVTPYYKRRFDALSGREVKLITNGFDEDDFADVTQTKSQKFILLHVGIVYSMVDPTVLIKSIELAFPEKDPARRSFEMRFVGEVNAAFRSAMKNSSVGSMVTFIDYVAHKELMTHYSEASMFLVNIQGYSNAEGLLPGKCFEYLACRLPILGIGPKESDLSVMLQETGAGKMFSPNEEVLISEFLLGCFRNWKAGRPVLEETQGMTKYSRRLTTSQLVGLLGGVDQVSE